MIKFDLLLYGDIFIAIWTLFMYFKTNTSRYLLYFLLLSALLISSYAFSMSPEEHMEEAQKDAAFGLAELIIGVYEAAPCPPIAIASGGLGIAHLTSAVLHLREAQKGLEEREAHDRAARAQEEWNKLSNISLPLTENDYPSDNGNRLTYETNEDPSTSSYSDNQ